ncbi:FAD-binding oxidoreductase [Kitasatospora sp. NBC_01300]|uniref:FAD-binding oxidoreductase n=1 Tax=Kitasatospora sp. NBC_01300 TaxID=2903574 RepID=UPI00352E731D|nr:FAD-binding protein [Kitasatospora sp. NBC_01300]
MGDLTDRLAQGLPAGAVVVDPDVTAAYRHDMAGFCAAGAPAVVVFPETVEQVQHVLRTATALRVPVVPQGARTGLSGAANAVDGCIVLSMVKLNRILELDPVNRIAVVEPGVVNAELSRAAEELGLSYPPDPSSWESCTIGGNIGTGAGGLCCVKYGVTSEYVLGLDVVLADGRLLSTGRRTAKGVAGYDLTRLLVGSEGTLGVVVRAVLALRPAPAPQLALAAEFPSADTAGAAVCEVMACGLTPSLMELMDAVSVRAVNDLGRMGLPETTRALLLVAFDGPDREAGLARVAELCRAAGATEVVPAEDEAESQLLLEARRLALPALTIGVVSHAGDGNTHPIVIFDGSDAEQAARAQRSFDEIMALGLELGGTITGEHGVGLLKRDWLARELGPVALDLQRQLKAVFDPLGIMNPGKMV